MNRTVTLAIVLIVTGASSAEAGIGAKSGEIGFDFGYTGFDPDYPGGSGARIALRGGYHVTSLFQIEAQYGASYDFETGTSFEANVQMTSSMLSGVFNFHPGEGNVVPYALVGAGYVRVLVPFPDGDDSDAAWQAAAGTRFFFGDHEQVAFRLEYARLFTDLAGISTAHDNITAGFTWRLGAGR